MPNFTPKLTRDAIVAQFDHLVPLIARPLARMLRNGFELDDLIQIGRLGLLAAAEKCDQNRTEREIDSYIRWKIRGAMLNYVRHAWKDAWHAPTVDAIAEGEDPEQAAIAGECVDAAEALPEPGRGILELRCRGFTQREVGRALSIPQPTVDRQERRAVGALRRTMGVAA